jgi:hypothetical protein
MNQCCAMNQCCDVYPCGILRRWSRSISRLATLACALASLLCLSGIARAETITGLGVDTETDPANAERVPVADRGLATGQWFWLQGKAMPGIELAAGRGLFELDLELSFLTLTERSGDLDSSFLGNQLGAFLMLTPLRGRYFDLNVGLGGDLYLLWGIQSGVSEAALAPRVVARIWPFENLGLTFMARSYLLHSDGMDLGTARDGSAGPPILLSTGITWRFF